METESNLTYTANNQDSQTWLVADNPYNEFIIEWGDTVTYAKWKKFKAEHPDILLTDHLPDGTKVKGNEIDVKWQYQNKIKKTWITDDSDEVEYMGKAHGRETRQVATLKQKREVVEDLTIKYLIFKAAKKEVDIYAKGRFYLTLTKTELQALKSWINKIEL